MARPKRIIENVYQIGGSDITYPSDCSIYLLVVDVEKKDYVMIDCGAGESFSMLIKNIISIGLDPKGIKALILTHCHIDHIGSANNFKERFGCEIIAHEMDADAIEGRDLKKTAASWYGVEYQAVSIDVIISGENKTQRIGNMDFYIIHTPGHTPGSISVFTDISGKRILFGQDIHGPFDSSFGSDINAWKTSMKKLLDLDADILCEGHFGVYEPKHAVREYIKGYLLKYS